MDRFRRGRARRARGHDGDRGRRRRPERHGDGDPRRRPLRHRPAPPAAGPGRARRSTPSTCWLVDAAATTDDGVEPARRGAGGVDRRLRAGRGRPRAARRGHDHVHRPEGPQRPQAGVAAPRPSWCRWPARRRSRSSTPIRMLADHPVLLDELACCSAQKTKPSSSSRECPVLRNAVVTQVHKLFIVRPC